MRPLAFTARCQRKTIQEQYALGVRCFDLRVRFNRHGLGIVAHGAVEYCFTASRVYEDLAWLDGKGDCYVRVLHEVRSRRQYGDDKRILFRCFCSRLQGEYGDIRFWCGRNLYSWEVDYDFGNYPSCEERYASVCPPKILDDWWPWLYARLNNSVIKMQGTDRDILMIDFIDI